MSLDSIGLMARNYKSFGQEWSGFSKISLLNMIVGRNNIGKSALVDLLELVTGTQAARKQYWHEGKTSDIIYTDLLSESALKQIFPVTHSGGPLTSPGTHWDLVGRHLVHYRVKIKMDGSNRSLFEFDLNALPQGTKGSVLNSFDARRGNPIDTLTGMCGAAVGLMPNPFSQKIARRLSADRDMREESANSTLLVQPNGSGATNALAQILIRTTHDAELVRTKLRHSLNTIFEPDASFSEIIAKQNDRNLWEIFLREGGEPEVSLADSGSGVKTVLLVLTFIYVVPYIEKKPLNDYLFSFEELENNLHPALQRRLLKYLCEVSKSKNIYMFFTTHSNVLIDFLSKDENAQIIHVTHDGKDARSSPVTTYVKHHEILDDLDVRASDLLQSNCIIWVEGPTDRLYVNRWIELKSNNKIREGQHYQCVFYGGRLLSHLSGKEPVQGNNDAVQILRVNRHAAILIDSDKVNEQSSLNSTKQRLITEVQSMSGFSWVTAGREIENYLPLAGIQAVYPDVKRQIGQYELFPEFLNEQIYS